MACSRLVIHALTATWRSGYAAVCKTVYPGSIPGVASNTRCTGLAARLEELLGARLGLWHSRNVIKRRHNALSKPQRLCYMRFTPEHLASFPGSSAVEQPAVNRLVAGSNPARGASKINDIANRNRSREAAWVRPGYAASRWPLALASSTQKPFSALVGHPYCSRSPAPPGPPAPAGFGGCGSWRILAPLSAALARH